MLVRILGLLSLRFHTIRWGAIECQTGEPLQPFINSRNVLLILLSSWPCRWDETPDDVWIDFEREIASPYSTDPLYYGALAAWGELGRGM